MNPYSMEEMAEHNFGGWRVLVFGTVVARFWTRERAEECAAFYRAKQRPVEIVNSAKVAA